MNKHVSKKTRTTSEAQFGAKLPKKLIARIKSEAALREIKIKDLIRISVEDYLEGK